MFDVKSSARAVLSIDPLNDGRHDPGNSSNIRESIPYQFHTPEFQLGDLDLGRQG